MKSLILVSGGADSATALAKFVQMRGAENVECLNVYYGQRHHREINAARQICKHYGVNLHEIDLQSIFTESNCSLLMHSTNEIPHGTYTEQIKQGDKIVSTYVPFRNGLFMSVATTVAISLGCDEVVCGVHFNDSENDAYPDCGAGFVNAMSEAVYLGSGKAVTVVAPFVSLTKSQVIEQGLKLGVPYELTWSCYKGDEKPCGVCATCIDRQKAFESNGAKDPLDY